jgi:hypothetical protein
MLTLRSIEGGIVEELDLIERWEDLDEFARAVIRNSGGRVWKTLAISFVGSRPDLVVEAPHFVDEQADHITNVLVDFFGVLRPERLAVLWPNRFEFDDGATFWAARVNSAEPAGEDGWRWRTRLHPYTVDSATGALDIHDSFDLDSPPVPWSQRLRTIYLRRTRRRLERRGWFEIPDEPGWEFAQHPDSTTLDEYERLGARA